MGIELEFQMPSHSTPRRDLTGLVFGRLTVIEPSAPLNKRTRWLCRCECGKETHVREDALKSGNTKSCGCARAASVRKSVATHGMSKTSTYNVWAGMIARCRNPNEPAYPYYGGRGIEVCDRWLRFENFLADMSERPEGLTLDRIDNDGNYEPGNCRWATRVEQGRNKRSNRLLTYEGETLPLSEWAERIGISDTTLWARLYGYRWSVERAISTGNAMYRRIKR